ncbi:MAG: NAD(P)-binding protein [Flavobacteriales bacterium]|jgi:protoporphyrinogen oxidase|nr:NAD(P)-binding protein [Flavobacteriales bacterium]
MKKIVVVGGGIAGIFSALLYRKKGYEVTLIERQKSLGGLLRSKELFKKDLFYDYGTHFLGQTGIAEVDAILFKDLEVNEFDFLKTGSFYKGLNEGNGFLSDKHIDNKEEGLRELIANTPKESYHNLKDHLENEYGKTFGNIIAQAAEKFFFTPAEKLEENSHALFGLSRIMVADANKTMELKKEPKYDKVLAFHSYQEGLSSLKSMYPKEYGVGNWIRSMEQSLTEAGVRVLKDTEVGKIHLEGKTITSLEVKNETIELDQLVWTVPTVFLMKNLGIEIKTAAPKRLTSCIFHYLVDQKYLTDLYYFNNFDPDYQTFRVTLYDNYSQGIEGFYRITVEAMTNQIPENTDQMTLDIFEELKQMKVISEQTELLEKEAEIYPNSFPVLDIPFGVSSKKQLEIVKENCENVVFFGKAKGKTWFMNHVIQDIFKSVQ